MNGLTHLHPDYSEFVELDPTGRYGRYNEILGKGASKIVYRAFDEYEGIEVAWNQVKLYDFLQSPEDLERLYSEIHLLKTLKHNNIMKFYTSWVDTANRNINFVTEMFTSGTLRQYRLKHRRVNIRAVKHWCRQILKGLLYLHSHDPPVIHRDLKCDNIFINGNQGEVKIGDLGLAAVLKKSHAAHCVGTPEFMAPEVYEEAYNELVDIYSFGMCILEMVTFEYPYSECTHPAQIYKKVISGKKPDALYKVKDPEVRQFVEKCLATVSLRLSAGELLDDPFLQIDDCEYDSRSLHCRREFDNISPIMTQPFLEFNGSRNCTISNGYSNDYCFESSNEWAYQPIINSLPGLELFNCHDDNDDDDHLEDIDVSIKGKMGEDGSIFLRLRISDKEGPTRNIYFPFDIEMDTALSVATEMVAELDMTDHDVTRIADMIDGEIVSLVPEWRSGPGLEETPRFTSTRNVCHNCVSNQTSDDYLVEYLSVNNDNNNSSNDNNNGSNNLEVLQCCRNGCTSMHGRFEEIMYFAKGAPNGSVSSGQSHLDEERDRAGGPDPAMDERKGKLLENGNRNELNPPSFCYAGGPIDETEIQQDMRWIRAKYQMELRELRDEQLGVVEKSLPFRNKEHKSESVPSLLHDHDHVRCPDLEIQRAPIKACSLLPISIHRTVSLPVDAVRI